MWRRLLYEIDFGLVGLLNMLIDLYVVGDILDMTVLMKVKMPFLIVVFCFIFNVTSVTYPCLHHGNTQIKHL